MRGLFAIAQFVSRWGCAILRKLAHFVDARASIVRPWMEIICSSRKMREVAFWYLWVPGWLPWRLTMAAIRRLCAPVRPQEVLRAAGANTSRHSFDPTESIHEKP